MVKWKLHFLISFFCTFVKVLLAPQSLLFHFSLKALVISSDNWKKNVLIVSSFFIVIFHHLLSSANHVTCKGSAFSWRSVGNSFCYNNWWKVFWSIVCIEKKCSLCFIVIFHPAIFCEKFFIFCESFSPTFWYNDKMKALVIIVCNEKHYNNDVIFQCCYILQF